MSEFLPKELREALDTARRAELRRRSRLCVHVGGEVFQLLRLWEDGFALDLSQGRRPATMRGLVDIYDGPRHLSECLVIASVEEDGEMVCDFKRATPAADRPAADFAREGPAPVALLPRLF